MNIYNSVDDSYFNLDLSKIGDNELIDGAFYKFKYKRPGSYFFFNQFKYTQFVLDTDFYYLNSIFIRSEPFGGDIFAAYTVSQGNVIYPGSKLNFDEINHKQINVSDEVAYICFTT